MILGAPIRKLIEAVRRARWRSPHVRIGNSVLIARGCDVRPGRVEGRTGAIEMGDGVELERGCILHAYGGTIRIGSRAFVGPYVVVYGHGGVEIGTGTLVSMHCRIVSSNHAVPPTGTPLRHCADKLAPTRIGNDVWLGAGVTVLAGVTIGDGCIVGAGAVVTHDLPAGAVAWGVPAVVQRWRDGARPPA